MTLLPAYRLSRFQRMRKRLNRRGQLYQNIYRPRVAAGEARQKDAAKAA